jgi:MFS family permease
MKLRIREDYNHTIFACFIGYIIQAIVNNFAPLLFLTFQREYGISLEKIALLISFNFGVQLLIDLLAAGFVDRIGYRICVVAAQFFAGIGLLSLAFLPDLLPDPMTGLMISVFIYAIGGGLIEVLISPIVEACPTKRKEAAMSLLHSFYCWGHAGVILLSTLFFACFGIDNWRILACLWAVIPFLNLIYFTQVPIRSLTEERGGMPISQMLTSKMFWLMILLMVCAGACEQGISQWASAFAEAGLHVTKTVGDLAGPCAFALLMGSSRALYAKFSEKISLIRFMVYSGILCLASYLLASLSHSSLLGLLGCALCGLSVGILWPGTFSLAAKHLPEGGTAMFALFALAGDLGCSSGPALVGFWAERNSGDMKAGILGGALFPVLLLIGLTLFLSSIKNSKQKMIY